jgi:hypothetical protein
MLSSFRSGPALLAALVLGLAVPPSPAEETAERHATGTPRVIVLDAERIAPGELSMQPREVLVFENQSVHAITVRFVSPADAVERIRCRFVRDRPEPSPPWMLFRTADGALEATIPPGRHASLCSFAPGTYTYTAERLIPKTRSPLGRGGLLPEKGQIVVRADGGDDQKK